MKSGRSGSGSRLGSAAILVARGWLSRFHLVNEKSLAGAVRALTSSGGSSARAGRDFSQRRSASAAVKDLGVMGTRNCQAVKGRTRLVARFVHKRPLVWAYDESFQRFRAATGAGQERLRL